MSQAPRRLLVVIGEMEIGGSQRQIVQLLSEIDRKAWAPEVAYFRRHSFLVDRLLSAGVPVHHIPKHRRLDPLFVVRFARLVRQGNYNLIHAFSLTAELWTLVALMGAGQSVPVVASVRGLCADQPRWYWRMKRFVFDRCSGIISNSRAGARNAAIRTGFPVDSIDIVENGVGTPAPMTKEERRELRSMLGAPSGGLMGLFVGRLVGVKNLACLIDALALLPAGRRPWVALAGEGPLRSELESRARERGVAQWLCFLGKRADTAQLMQVADFLVLPSLHEGMSNAVLEAMVAGCPVIASDVGGNRELIEHGCTGLLFPSDDAAALSVAIARLGADPQLRESISRMASQYAFSSHGVHQLVRNTVMVYERCLANGA
jgi:glycosyltransferase involved in cell wall biosynthesis